MLKAYKEAAWNNPVVRFVDATEKDVIPRVDDYSTHVLLKRMAAALEAAKKPVPKDIQAALSGVAIKPATATFAMYCYWDGEAKLGNLDGVVASRIGSFDGMEAVEVTYDSAVINYRELVQQANTLKCTSRVFTRTDAEQTIATEIVGTKAQRTDHSLSVDTQQQYSLAQLPRFHYLPLNAFQATKLNACAAFSLSPAAYLTDEQMELWKRFATLKPTEYEAIRALKVVRTEAGQKALRASLTEILKLKK